MSPPPLIRTFHEFAEQRANRSFPDYEALHRWSIEEARGFWSAVWDFDSIQSPEPPTEILTSEAMPGAQWFPGTKVNYARQVLRHADAAHAAGHPAIIAEDERGPVEVVDWPTLRRRVASFALALRDLGVRPGDRVVAYLPNRPEAAIAFLACASIGATWAICAPDMGVPAILDRFRQIEPKVLIATDGAFYAGKQIDLAQAVQGMRDGLPGLQALVLVRSGLSETEFGEAYDFTSMAGRTGAEVDAFEPEWLPFDHPLWVVYSSGTTGKPKALVHGHGGILLNGAVTRIHSDLGASYDERTPGERFHWFSSTGWMMWNIQISGLASGTTICIFDGSPTGSREAPDLGLLWRFVSRNRVTFFGSGAPLFTLCVKSGLDVGKVADLTHLRALGSTAAPLPAAAQTSISKQLAAAGKPDVWWFNCSGGTDICGAFCTGNRELPVAPGKLQSRQLGAAVEAWDESGNAVIDEVGELICTRPLPNMPLFLWGDQDGARYKASYFDLYPGVWRHGDWLRIEADGTCEIFGRSDATINRGGHRMGTSEIYAAIEQLDEVADSLVIDVRVPDADNHLLLFVVPSSGTLTQADEQRIRGMIRTSLSPRFLPNQIVAVKAIPRTLSSKKQELPIKRIFEGVSVDRVIDPSAMANPECLADYGRLAEAFRSGRPLA